MQKQLTVTLEEQVYEGLLQSVGRENISQFISGLIQSHVVKPDISELEASYREMAADEEREAEAMEWCEALIGDVNEAR